MPEEIICRICFSKHSLRESTKCSCGEKIYTGKELRHRLVELASRISTLQEEYSAIWTEVELRKIRQAHKGDGLFYVPVENFWRGVVRSGPRQAGGPSLGRVRNTPEELAQFV